MGGVAVGLTVTLGLTGCGKGSSSSDDKGDNKTIKLVAAKYDDDTKGYWDALIQDFQSKNAGYKVNVEIVDWEQMDAKVKSDIQTKQQPDILNYNKFADFARDGLSFKADEVVSPNVLSDFLPLFVNGAKFQGTQYGLPFISSTRLFFYNKAIFQKAGIKEAPKTWAELKSAAEKIKKAGSIPYGLPLGPEEAQAEFFLWSMNNNGGWVDQSNKFVINQAANVETLTFLKDLTKAGLTQPNPETTQRKDTFNQFAEGKIGMVNGAVFMRKGFLKPAGDKIQYGIAPVPSKDGSTHNTLGVQDFLVAFKKNDGKNKDAVKKFLDFFYQKENSAKFLTTEGFLSVTKSAGDALAADPYYKPFVDGLTTAKFAPTDLPAWAAVDGAVKQSLGSAVAKEDPKKTLDKIQQAAEKAG